MAKAPKFATASAEADATAVVPVTASTTGEVTPPTDKPADAWELEITNPPLMVGMKPIVRVTLAPLSFVEFIDIMKRAEVARLRDGAEKNAKYFSRERMRTQARCHDALGHVHTMTDIDIMTMPRVWGIRIREAIDQQAGGGGRILTDGDGIASPILFQLAKPIALGVGEARQMNSVSIGDARPSSTTIDGFDELEFIATTYGEIEDVLAETNEALQTLALIQKCARPVNAPGNLITLPSWAVDQIGVSDGIRILENVLPRFLS